MYPRGALLYRLFSFSRWLPCKPNRPKTDVDLLDVGVETCWLVQLPLRPVTVFPDRPDGTVADPVLDLEIDVKEVFDPEE